MNTYTCIIVHPDMSEVEMKVYAKDDECAERSFAAYVKWLYSKPKDVFAVN